MNVSIYLQHRLTMHWSWALDVNGRDRDVCLTRRRRDRDVDNFSGDETLVRLETETTTLAAHAWNSLPPSVLSTSSLPSFSLHLKTRLLPHTGQWSFICTRMSSALDRRLSVKAHTEWILTDCTMLVKWRLVMHSYQRLIVMWLIISITQ